MFVEVNKGVERLEKGLDVTNKRVNELEKEKHRKKERMD